MNCDECIERVFELIEQEASDPARVRAILEQCPDCRALFEETKARLALAAELPLEDPPAALDSLAARVDFVARLCAAWDFGILPDPETVAEIRRPEWREPVDACRLLTSPVYHLVRRWHGRLDWTLGRWTRLGGCRRGGDRGGRQ